MIVGWVHPVRANVYSLDFGKCDVRWTGESRRNSANIAKPWCSPGAGLAEYLRGPVPQWRQTDRSQGANKSFLRNGDAKGWIARDRVNRCTHLARPGHVTWFLLFLLQEGKQETRTTGMADGPWKVRACVQMCPLPACHKNVVSSGGGLRNSTDEPSASRKSQLCSHGLQGHGS